MTAMVDPGGEYWPAFSRRCASAADVSRGSSRTSAPSVPASISSLWSARAFDLTYAASTISGRLDPFPFGSDRVGFYPRHVHDVLEQPIESVELRRTIAVCSWPLLCVNHDASRLLAATVTAVSGVLRSWLREASSADFSSAPRRTTSPPFALPTVALARSRSPSLRRSRPACLARPRRLRARAARSERANAKRDQPARRALPGLKRRYVPHTCVPAHRLRAPQAPQPMPHPVVPCRAQSVDPRVMQLPSVEPGRHTVTACEPESPRDVSCDEGDGVPRVSR